MGPPNSQSPSEPTCPARHWITTTVARAGRVSEYNGVEIRIWLPRRLDSSIIYLWCARPGTTTRTTRDAPTSVRTSRQDAARLARASRMGKWALAASRRRTASTVVLRSHRSCLSSSHSAVPLLSRCSGAVGPGAWALTHSRCHSHPIAPCTRPHAQKSGSTQSGVPIANLAPCRARGAASQLAPSRRS